ncbi:hypothetical protein ABPG74_012196 [Tetrahymena malaccensis]
MRAQKIIQVLAFLIHLFEALVCQQTFTYPPQDKIYINNYVMSHNFTSIHENITVQFQLNCSVQNRKLLISNLILDVDKSQTGFSIDIASQNDTSATFQLFKSSFYIYQIQFTLAEICIDSFNVERFNITQTSFNETGQYQFLIKNSKLSKDMAVFPFLTGVISNTNAYQTLFIQDIQLQDGGFTINFQSNPKQDINQININYIYYDKTNNPYYQIFQYVDTKYRNQEINISRELFPSNFTINQNYYCQQSDCLKYSMVGLTGYNQSTKYNQTNLRQIIQISMQPQKIIQIGYTKWADSFLYGIQSQFLLFQMVICQNGLANFQDKCQECPKGYFKYKDLNTNLYNCVYCDKNMVLNLQNIKCECPPKTIFNQNLQLCVCEDSSYYLDLTQYVCLNNPAQKNCEILENFLPSCNKCLSGFQNINGHCQYCGNGKFADESTNLCSQQCQDYCFLCTNKQTCIQLTDDFPCHFSCQLCSIPNSSQSCSLCSSSTRVFNSTDSTCNCRYGYEESNKTDCIQIVQSYSQQFLTFMNVIQGISFYMQLIQVLIPLYPHLQYSFMLQQQIGIISKYLQNNTNNLRIEILQLVHTELDKLFNDDNNNTYFPNIAQISVFNFLMYAKQTLDLAFSRLMFYSSLSISFDLYIIFYSFYSILIEHGQQIILRIDFNLNKCINPYRLYDNLIKQFNENLKVKIVGKFSQQCLLVNSQNTQY